jgi:hypothetical protein
MNGPVLAKIEFPEKEKKIPPRNSCNCIKLWFILHSPNVRNSIDGTSNYHHYLTEPRRQRSCLSVSQGKQKNLISKTAYILTITQNLLNLGAGDYWNMKKIESGPNSFHWPSMTSLMFNRESFSVSIASFVASNQLFQTRPRLLGKPCRVESCIASDSLRVFIGAMAEMSDVNVPELSQLCDEFKFIELVKTVRD